jgi:hypothetical protein
MILYRSDQEQIAALCRSKFPSSVKGRRNNSSIARSVFTGSRPYLLARLCKSITRIDPATVLSGRSSVTTSKNTRSQISGYRSQPLQDGAGVARLQAPQWVDVKTCLSIFLLMNNFRCVMIDGTRAPKHPPNKAGLIWLVNFDVCKGPALIVCFRKQLPPNVEIVVKIRTWDLCDVNTDLCVCECL